MTHPKPERLSTSDIAGATPPEVPPREPTPEAVPPLQRTDERTSLFPSEETDGFRSRWDAIQTGFVDQPRAAVEEADALVAQLMKRLAEIFAEERHTLEQQWDRGERVSTEDLRIALTRYRSFFHRLLSM